jgi:diguanylate cyclase (GGDEF)-like protein
MRRIGLDTGRPLVRPGHAIEWLTALAMVLAVGMLALGGMFLLDSRAEAWHRAEQGADNLVLALTGDVARTIARYDVSLQRVSAGLLRPDIDRISPETRQMVLFDRDENPGSLVVSNPKGDLIASASTLQPPKVNVSGQDYFRIHQQRADAGLFIGRALPNPMLNDEAAIAISRRLARPDGTFAGVAVGILPPAYFSDLFGKLDLESAGSVTLLRSDGRVIVRLPFRDSDIDDDMGKTPIFQRYADSEAGRLVGTGSLDGVNRFYTFRHLPNLPLILSVGVAVDDIDGAWWHDGLGIGLVLAVFCGAMVVLSLRFRREVLRRTIAEATLRGAAVQLAMTPARDGLTGLANRRAFDERLTREWGRSVRAGTPIALLLLDADLFKGFNDLYGHGEGDQVLRSIAKCIMRNVLRPSDTGARYDGEEFAVLLPETDLLGAEVVADRIRAAVASLAIPNDGSPIGHVTVSIGVTIARPLPGDTQASLVARAGAALNAAKDAGRNRVSRATADGAVSVGERPLFRQPMPMGAMPMGAMPMGAMPVGPGPER